MKTDREQLVELYKWVKKNSHNIHRTTHHDLGKCVEFYFADDGYFHFSLDKVTVAHTDISIRLEIYNELFSKFDMKEFVKQYKKRVDKKILDSFTLNSKADKQTRIKELQGEIRKIKKTL